MFGVYPSFEFEPADAVDVPKVAGASGEGDNGWGGGGDYRYPKDADAYWKEYERRFPADRYYQDRMDGNDWMADHRMEVPAPAA